MHGERWNVPFFTAYKHYKSWKSLNQDFTKLWTFENCSCKHLPSTISKSDGFLVKEQILNDDTFVFKKMSNLLGSKVKDQYILFMWSFVSLLQIFRLQTINHFIFHQNFHVFISSYTGSFFYSRTDHKLNILLYFSSRTLTFFYGVVDQECF